MSRNPPRESEPVGVLVVTVWSDEFGVRRVVSQTDPESGPGGEPLALLRSYAADDAAVLDVVTAWLTTLRDRTGRPGPWAVT